MKRILSLLAAPFLLATGDAALAEAKLLSSIPAADAKASAVRSLSLTFSEPLAEGSSEIDLVMTGMPGMASHRPMKVSGFKTVLDGRTLTVILPRALPAGSYSVAWRTADAQGNYSFSAK